ncbi:AmmeMemoRadiSam system protein B [candidate division KSB1 bacterium]|nr:AmmeMemoRadiSam system protein B [candidate division KSB1 bacterium]
MKRVSHPFHKGFSEFEFPKARMGLQPFQCHDQQNKIYIGLKDPLKLSDTIVLLPQDLYYLIQFFDGSHSLSDIASLYRRQFGTFLPVDRLTKMIKKMDDGLLLDNKRSEKRLDHIKSTFRKQAFRPPICSGSCYASDEATLIQELEQYRRCAATPESLVEKFTGTPIKAMITPHIDPRLGGAAYAAAYNILHVAQPVDLFVILGISHQQIHYPFAVTDKDFQTPLGVVKTDDTFINKIRDTCSFDIARDEIVHRDEHSVEFQTIFLKYYHKAPFKICPVLCSFSHDMTTAEKNQFTEFVASIRASLETYAGCVSIIASVDFSHIGKHYGHDFVPDSYLLAKVENADKSVLDAIAQQNIAAFEQYFIRSNNKYNICGYPALRTLLELLPPSQATVLQYDNAIMDENRSTVTFASMIFS